jgi:act minimal PKS acyl carrier protein
MRPYKEEQMSPDDLITILKAVGGADDVGLGRDAADTPLTDLGFDSLALLELQSQIKLRHGIPVPDDTIELTMSPNEIAERVSALVPEAR